MKKIFTLLMAMTLMTGAMSATTIYCRMSQGWWKADGAAVGAYAWKGDGSSAVTNANWPGVRMTAVTGETDLWSIELELSQYEKIIFTRMNPLDEGNQDWGAKTKDLTLPTDGKNLFTITTPSAVWGDPGCDGEWSVYTPGEGPGPGPGPDPNADAYWYWKGEVDGIIIQNEIDGGIFDGGISEITVDQQAYIFVVYQVKGVAGVQYMTDGWKGTDVTHVTMQVNGNDKLYIPAGTHTLYLYDNGDQTVELSREPLPGKTLMGGGTQNEAIEQAPVNTKAHKAIINGQLVIIRGEKMFDATGRQL